MIVVSNATPLIGLAKIEQLPLLRDLFATVLIAHAVFEEVVLHGSNRPGAAEIRQADWIQVRRVADRTRVDYLRSDLDYGEAETLVLSDELRADWVLMDEAKGRLAAELLGLRMIGTLGLLLLGKRMGKVTAVRPLLDTLRANKFYINDRMYHSILAEAGE